jgi:hypothetical protein
VEALSPQEVVRPWRTAAIVAGSVAALELILLIGAAALIFAKPISRVIRHHAATTSATPVKAVHHVHRRRPHPPPPKPKLARKETKVFVLNGNGRNGVAHSTARKLGALGYEIAGADNAPRQDYATTVVMYRPGYRAEGLRLAHDVHAKIVGPLDGLRASALDGGQLALILGAS